MSLMSNLYIGVSGLQTSQNALNTTAHNLSNVDTVGYTRQQVQQSDKSYVTIATDPRIVSNKQTGLGVTYSNVKQVRDYFLDKAYRKESGRSMFYQVSTEVLEEVESLLGELNGEAFQNPLSDLWTAVQELSKDPCSSVTQGLFVQRASEFVERAVAIYDGLSSYQDNLNLQIKQQVDKINEYGHAILELNDRIRSIEVGGIEHPNDLRDTRNRMLDELAELTNMTWQEDALGNVAVQIEGVDFVKGGMCYEISMDLDATTGFYTPFWSQNATYRVLPDGTRKYNIDGAEVFNLNIEISSDLGTDVGGLKAMLLARGDHRANYSDIAGNNYDQISQSVIMNIQAEFDQLVHNVSGKINEILATAAGVEKGTLTNVRFENGTTTAILNNAHYAKDEVGGYMRAEDGSPLQMFTKYTTEGYRKVTATDANGNTGEFWVYVEEDLEQQDTLYTVDNLRVNPELMQKPSSLGFRLKDGSEDKVDKETVEALKKAFTEEVYTLNPNVRKTTSFNGYYIDLVAQVANSGSVFRSIYENQENTVESTLTARDQVVAVSSDEELSNMIKFQNAYNASSRYINVVDEMLEHILNTLGV
ncbi:MAG: flagellar hook-associated protein FlgK [Bacteroidales bacterium]|nr:flagellar hook-associated protein FlgK [Lachnoclostridium sp.]MCM1385209.1 flagellar hook-associated protein FlgK [Lachnoclostridium sp.]MCM1466106.1 flagellar hook-associated protein FlgK [Bacteroidales bacterium]